MYSVKNLYHERYKHRQEKASPHERGMAYWIAGFGQQNGFIKSAFVSCNAYAVFNKL